MSNFGALFARLLGFGVPEQAAAEILHEAVTIGVNTVDFRHPEIEKVEERRARDRARKAGARVSADIQGIPRNSAETKPAKEIPPTPPKENTTPLSPTGTVPRGQHALPKDYAPSEAVYAYAANLNPPLAVEEVDRCAEAMRNWAWGKGIRRASWDRTLYKFLQDRSADKAKPIPFNRGDRNGPSIQQTANALADWAERRAASGE